MTPTDATSSPAGDPSGQGSGRSPDAHEAIVMPTPARRAVWLMLAGALVQAVSTIGAAADRGAIRTRTAELAREYKKRTLTGAELERASDQAHWFGIATGVTFVLTWLVVARLFASGRAIGRVIATVLAIVYTFTFAFSGWRSLGPGALLGLLTAALAVSVVYLVWRRPVTPWLAARAARRSPGP